MREKENRVQSLEEKLADYVRKFEVDTVNRQNEELGYKVVYFSLFFFLLLSFSVEIGNP